MRVFGWMVLSIACAQPLAVLGDYYGQTQDPYDTSEPMAYSSPPPTPYTSTSPQEFDVISDEHDFSDSRLPAVGDTRPRVLIRTYDPQVGVFVDTEVTDKPR